jgi:hypothetical protein
MSAMLTCAGTYRERDMDFGGMSTSETHQVVSFVLGLSFLSHKLCRLAFESNLKNHPSGMLT